MLVRDVSNSKSVLFVDGDRARDVNGKVVAVRSGSDEETAKLTLGAAEAMVGRKVLLDLAPADVVTPATQAEMGIPDGDYVADLACPVRYVTHDRGYFYIENATDSIQLVLPEVSAAGSVPELNPNYTNTLFTTIGYGLMAKLPRLVVGNADFDIRRRTVIRLVQALKLAREYRVWNLLTTSTSWAAANRVAATAKWNGGASSDPLADLFTALSKSVLPANLLIMPENAAPFFFANPTVSVSTVNRVQNFVQAGGVLPRIVTAQHKISAAGVPAYLWGPANPVNVALVRNPGDPDRIPSATTFRWLGKDGSKGEEKAGMLVRQFRQDDSEFIVVVHNDVDVMVANTVGAVITGALA
jgi:hypothetical protein